MKKLVRKAGVLLHPTSLPSQYGVGDLGDKAYKFIDKLRNSNVKLWQILPLGPTGYGDSPYAARSTFAGNEILISPRSLYEDGYLELGDVLPRSPMSERVNYEEARQVKLPLLKKAALSFIEQKAEKKEFDKFCKDSSFWLEDYAMYQVLCDHYNDSRWFSVWPQELRVRDEKAIADVKKKFKTEIMLYKVYQYFFFKQWFKLKGYANANNVEIIGDIPIFVAPDSVDAWVNTKLLKIDENGVQESNSGVPPDAFSSTGQLWGNPLYRWEEHEKTNFDWWVSRVGETLKMCDIVRIDHFRGLAACWEVPSNEPTAMNGKWVEAPGQKLLDALKKNLGDDLPIIAEDLGVITPDVEELRDSNNLPGMKILQFAFEMQNGEADVTNAYLPHNCIYNSVVYTGTHDNNTTLGWYKTAGEGVKDFVRRYLETGDDDVVYKLIKAMLFTPARYAILPFQDILCLDENGRMNTPNTCGNSNWSWKMSEEMLDADNMGRLSYYIHLSGR